MVQGGGAFRKDAVKKKLNGKVKAAHSRKQIENKSRRYNQTVIPKDPHRLELYKSGQVFEVEWCLLQYQLSASISESLQDDK